MTALDLKQLAARWAAGTRAYDIIEAVIGSNALAIGTTTILLSYAFSVDAGTRMDGFIWPLWWVGCCFLAVSCISLLLSILVRRHLSNASRRFPLSVAASYFVTIVLYLISVLAAVAVVNH